MQKVVYKNQYPIEIFGLEEQNGDIQQTIIAMQWPMSQEPFQTG